MADDKLRTTIRVEEEIIDKIKYIAKTSKRSFNSQVEYFLEECVKDYEKEHGIIKIIQED